MIKSLIKIFPCIFIFLTALPLRAQYSVYDFDPVVVTSSRIPTALSSSLRTLTVLDRDMIASSGAQSVEELLETSAGIDIRSRGPLGVQSDVSIRGAGFEQTLVLIDGVKISDPQTAHHNLNLPVSPDNIERIEILKGSGSKLYGPNAFGGVINIITRKALHQSTTLKLKGGEHGLFEGSASISLPVNHTTNLISISKKQSDGYRHNTDFDITNLFYKSTLKTGRSDLGFSSGYTVKDFGANGFYSLNYPNQREDTRTLFVNTSADFQRQWGWISARFNWRRHKDHYLLDYQNSKFYENNHTTDVIQADIQTTIIQKYMKHNIGVEFGQDAIRSNNLGNHERFRSGLYYEGQFRLMSTVDISAGASAYHYSGWGWNFWPGIDIGYNINEKFRWTGSVGRAFRVPTFTELYYNSPADLGNTKLKPESAWTLEQNLLYSTTRIQSSAAVFYRRGNNLIDWVKSADDDPWQALNIAVIRTYGLEYYLSLSPKSAPISAFIRNVSFSYAYLHNDKSISSYQSKYLLNSLRHQLITTISFTELLGIKNRWAFRFEDRLHQNSHIVIDTHLTRTIGSLSLSFSVTNLFDADYADFSGIPMPGRWIRCGIEYSFISN